MLAGLLDYHSSLEVGMELFALDCLMGRKIKSKDPRRIYSDRTDAFMKACVRMAKKHAKCIWGNKITTEQFMGLEDHNTNNQGQELHIFDTFFNHTFKKQKIVFILRDGRSCVNSKVKRTGQPIENACRKWSYSVEMYRFLKNCHRNNRCIKFEDLLADTESVLSDICDYLGIEYQAQMSKGVENTKMIIEYRSKGIDLGRTRDVSLPKRYLAMIQQDLEHCGYIGTSQDS